MRNGLAMLVMAAVMTWGPAAWGFEDDPYGPSRERDGDRYGTFTRVNPDVSVDSYGGTFARDRGTGVMVDPRDGRVFAPAGPNGYIDTRTGQFYPAN